MDVESLTRMTVASPISLETLKFHLIWNKDFSFSPENRTVSLEELVEFLIESLEDADKNTASKAENLLTRIGKPAVPYLVQGLKSGHGRVKSVCAMALIRIGQPAVEEMKDFYVRNASRAKVRWVAEFILEELRVPLPSLEKPEFAGSRKVISLAKAAAV